MAKTQTQTPPSTIVVIPAIAPQQVLSPQVLASVLKDKGGASSNPGLLRKVSDGRQGENA